MKIQTFSLKRVQKSGFKACLPCLWHFSWPFLVLILRPQWHRSFSWLDENDQSSQHSESVCSCVCIFTCVYVCVHTSFFVALELIPELQPSADSSTYLTLPPTVILWRECESLNTSCHNGAPGHPMAWWPTSLTGITRACSRISSVCPCVTSVFAQVCGLIYTRSN